MSGGIRGSLADFQFITSRILKMEYESKTILWKDEFKKYFDVDYEVNAISEVDEGFLGEVILKIKIKIKDGNRVMIKLDFDILGAFTIKGKNKEEFETMLKYNGLAVLYGIARAQIISMTALAFDNRELNLPMINIYSFIEEKEKQKG